MNKRGVAQSKVEDSNYFRSLDPDVADRYKKKIALLGGRDPYSIKDTVWCTDFDTFPDVTYPDIVTYLVFGTSVYSLDDFRAHKSLEAYNQFACGWVKCVRTMKFGENILISSKVLHSQKMNEKPLEPWIIIHKTGRIVSAHCNCMAGLGEACTHVAAALFFIEAAVRIRNNRSVTDVPAYWTVPTLNKVECMRLRDIDFSTAKRKLQMSGETNHVTDISTKSGTIANDVPVPSAEEFKTFLKKLEETGSSSVILSIVEPFCQKFVRKDLNVSLNLNSLFKEENSTLNYDELVKLGSSVQLAITADEATKMQNLTKQQAKSKKWFQLRAGRITASNFRAACRTKSSVSAPSLVKAICYPIKNIKIDATAWGCNHEKLGLHAYSKKQSSKHTNFQVKDCGIFLNPKYPYLGATPDGVIFCDCCGSGCLEIKCPFCLKGMSLKENISRVRCLTSYDDGSVLLNHEHEYFFQIQAQLFITEFLYCDFVVWAPKGEPHIERIYPDKLFWAEEEQKASVFFKTAILPELLGKYFTRSAKSSILQPKSFELDNRQWCICKTDCGGEMIMCDQENCQVLWYHTKCIGMKTVPKGKWYCFQCR